MQCRSFFVTSVSFFVTFVKTFVSLVVKKKESMISTENLRVYNSRKYMNAYLKHFGYAAINLI